MSTTFWFTKIFACYYQAIQWRKEIQCEYDVVIQSQSWEIVECPNNVKPISCKWFYRIKYKENGEIDKYKDRLVTKGFS